ncbi:MAG: glycoside hydrolase family 3 C-terminal domain-containing protein [Bryobacteraceae bacterium]|nr:glycoside hydrolase family 3 C-terminal domain-containing protein [Bryobacteraceae bacterium]
MRLTVLQALVVPLSASLLAAQSGAGQFKLGSADIHSLLRQMTLDEKLSLLRGARDPESLGQAGYWPGLPRLGIPPLRFADGPAGVMVAADATAMPAPVLLAATFSPDLARRFGEVLGREARSLRQNVLLAPYVNIVRDPLFRRIYSTLGEDPTLSAALGAAIVEGIQQQGVLAQAKHIAAYNGPDSVFLDERTLREIYLPVFESAIRAGVSSLMCAYNRVNGLPACHNPELLNRWLRQEMGFEGFVTSDWGAVYGPDALAAGTDLEMPGREIAGRGGPYFSEALKAAIEKGEIPLSAVDQALSRILRQLDRFGVLAPPPPASPSAIDVEKHAAVVLQIAEQGAVLLKNDGVLPLTPEDLASLAVIGPNARQLVTGYLTERASGFPHRLVSPLEALRRLAPEANIRYALGGDLTGIALAAPALANAPLLDFTGANAIPPGESFAWSGTLRIEEPGDYTFMVQTGVGQGAAGSGEILIGGRPVVRSTGFRGFGSVQRPWSSLLPTIDGLDNARATVALEAGTHDVELRAVSTGKAPLRIRFAWMNPALRRRHIEEAARLAASSKAAVVFVWHEAGTSLSLSEDQDELIRRVAAANPRTIVVLNSGGPIAMPWKDPVRAILQMWYPGQEGGWATANLLLGHANPGGRLPLTFPARLEDIPVRAPGHPERWAPPAPPGATGLNPDPPAVRFTEGLAVGYRWYDAQNIQPLFPFGYGLSYTTFEYSGLRLRRRADGVEVSFTLRNTGRRAGEEVAQVYLGPPEEDRIDRPPRALAAFARIRLEPGQSRRVTLRLDRRALSYWSAAERRWAQSGRPREIFVGGSSRDLPLRGRIPPTTPDSPARRRG